MKRIWILIIIVCLESSVVVAQSVIDSFFQDSAMCYAICADVHVSMPMSSQIEEYRVNVFSSSNVRDKLLPVKYLIESVRDDDLLSFSAYFDGNYYSYVGGRLRDFCWENDSLPFVEKVERGRIVMGVHKNGLMSILVPSLLKEQIENIVCDKKGNISVLDSIVENKKCKVMKVCENMDDEVVKQMEFTIDAETHVPIRYIIVSNPMSHYKQVIDIRFSSNTEIIILDEMLIKNRYADIFAEKYKRNICKGEIF